MQIKFDKRSLNLVWALTNSDSSLSVSRVAANNNNRWLAAQSGRHIAGPSPLDYTRSALVRRGPAAAAQIEQQPDWRDGRIVWFELATTNLVQPQLHLLELTVNLDGFSLLQKGNQVTFACAAHCEAPLANSPTWNIQTSLFFVFVLVLVFVFASLIVHRRRVFFVAWTTSS